MKKPVVNILFLIALLALLPGCSLTIGSSEMVTVEPGAGAQPVQVVETAAPAVTEAAEVAAPAVPADLRPIAIDHVQILTGWASPIPALVDVSGTWPDLCGQLAQIGQPLVDGYQIDIHLLATPADLDCPPDYLGLPFAIQIPLNWGELPEGAYTVNVNGQQTELYIPVIPAELGEGEQPELGFPVTPTPGAAPPANPVFPAVAQPQPAPVPVTVQDVHIEVGVGSPSIVHAVLSAGWPGFCAQLASVTQQVEPFRFEFEILAHPGRPDCPPDLVGYGFGLRLPLNAVELPEGTYTVSVNGTETSFTIPL